MNIEDFKKLKFGDIVFYVHNTGSAGVFKYQYVCIATCHGTGEPMHVFLSEHFLSTVCILEGKEERSRKLPALHLDKYAALRYVQYLKDNNIE